MKALRPGPVLALVDGTAAAAHAAWRAALVARDHGVPLRLLHAAGADADRVHGAPGLASEMAQRLHVVVEALACEGDPLAAAVREARTSLLLVLGSRRGNPLREWVLGTQAERLLRLCRVPVLVVKRPAGGSYRRVLAAVDLHPDAADVLATATLFSRDPRMEVLHALDSRDDFGLRVAGVAEAALRRERNRAAERAGRVLEDLIVAAGAAPHGAHPAVTFGDAAAAVLARERAMRAELVVIGKRQRGLLADFFLGGVTQRVLAAARADVLVLPVAGTRAAGEWSLDAARPAVTPRR